MEAQDELKITAERTSDKQVKFVARLGDKVIHADVIDPARASGRVKFVKGLKKIVTVLDEEDISAQLLRLSVKPPDEPPPVLALDRELDARRMVRPEQFYTPEVSGITVPVILDGAEGPEGLWLVHLRWADDKRSCLALPESLALSDDARLWIHPIPGPPARNVTPMWSKKSRSAWLSGAPAPDPAEVFKRLCERIAHFLELPVEVAAPVTALLALWTILTYGYQAWRSVPYLSIGGTWGSGKSTVFDILGLLVFRAMTSSNITGPALFRTLHDRGGTLLLDEAERLKQGTPEVAELLSMLLAGYKRGGRATRLEPVGDKFMTVEFDVYCPKALAGIAGLPGPLASRSIPIQMFKAPVDSPKPKRKLQPESEVWQALRDDLHVMALTNSDVWPTLAQQAEVCPAGINGRDAELWQPILAIASWIESHGAHGLLKLMQDYALVSTTDGKEELTPEQEEMVLEVLAESVRNGEQLTPGDILKRGREKEPALFEKWIAKTVSSKLKNYGIPIPKKSNGKRRYKVGLTQLFRIQQNYGIDLGIPDPATTNHPPTPADRP